MSNFIGVASDEEISRLVTYLDTLPDDFCEENEVADIDVIVEGDKRIVFCTTTNDIIVPLFR